MYETLVALIAAHLISDFALQSDWMVSNKRHPGVFLSHILIVGVTAAVLIGARDAVAALAVTIIVLTHLLVDYVKVRSADNLLTFIADQIAHVVIVVAIAFIKPDLAVRGFWAFLPGDAQNNYYALLVYASGLITAVPLGGILIKKMIKPFVPLASGKSRPQSPANAGRYIGWLERSLTFAFIVAKQPEGVGFLLAAKSVLRIGDLKDEHDRSHAEYIIIGTFLSFGWGIVVAFATAAVASHWPFSG